MLTIEYGYTASVIVSTLYHSFLPSMLFVLNKGVSGLGHLLFILYTYILICNSVFYRLTVLTGPTNIDMMIMFFKKNIIFICMLSVLEKVSKYIYSFTYGVYLILLLLLLY